MSINELIWIMPILLILHEFEEIVFASSWTDCHGKKYKKISDTILPVSLINTMSCATVLIFLTCMSIASALDNYMIDFLLFSLFLVHLFSRVISTIKHRTLIPGTITAFITIPLCTYILYSILDILNFTAIFALVIACLILLSVIIYVFFNIAVNDSLKINTPCLKSLKIR